MHKATQEAIFTFREVERARLLLARKEHLHKIALLNMSQEAPLSDRPEYHKSTERIEREYAKKAEKAGLTI